MPHRALFAGFLTPFGMTRGVWIYTECEISGPAGSPGRRRRLIGFESMGFNLFEYADTYLTPGPASVIVGLMNQLPSRIRMLRLRQQRTLSDVAGRCGFTISLLSKIESGKTTPPVATLAKIATALGVSLGNLLDGSRDASTVLTPARQCGAEAATRTDKGYGFHLLAAERADKIMQPFIFVAERGKIKPGAMAHCGEEFIHVLKGRMRYRVGGTTHTMGPGDSLYFSSEEEHDLEPLTARVKYLAIFTGRAAPVKKASPRTRKKNQK